MNLPQLKIGDLVAKVPVIQGGMGVGISLSGLASAVAKEGGIGVIAAAMIGLTNKNGGKDHAKAHIDTLAEEIRKAKEMTSGILGVNIMVALSNFADMVSTSVKEGADVIFSGAGLPLDLPKYVSEGAKTKLVPIVSSGRAATIICKKWMSKFDYIPDAFVVEGPKAGGHLGFKREQLDDPMFALENILPEVIKAVKPFEEKLENPSLSLLQAEFIPVKISANSSTWAQQACRWEQDLLPPTNATLMKNSNRPMSTQPKKTWPLSKAPSDCQEEPLKTISFKL